MDIVYELCPDLLEKLSEIEDFNEKETAIESYIRNIITKVLPVKDFPENLEWFNVNSPLSLRHELSGKVVLLDFFTYCCINCLHVLPELKAIENKYKVRDGLLVVGVHSAKFETEKESSNVAAAVLRHEITHPVVNDAHCAMWEDLNIACWPTLLILGPGGYPLFILMGEGHSTLLDLFIRVSLKYFKSHNKITQDELPQICLNSHLAAGSLLKFPGRVALHNKWLAISDSGHHKILIVNIKTGIIETTIGYGTSGLKDGDFEEAKFNVPQGLAWFDENILYVADTENHAIRMINLKENQVKTVAGTGQMGTDKEGGLTSTSQVLSSPWGLAFEPSKKVLLIAMAGTHQIWGLILQDVKWWKGRELKSGTCVSLAGSGREENRNGAYPMASGFAQPSGLTLVGERIVLADSESSSIRQINLTDGKVSAIVGGTKDPTNLFAFGDEDGKGVDARLQHPLDVAWSEKDKTLYAADTFNHKIKKINLESTTCESIKLEGDANVLLEPGGICVDDSEGILIIADTNHHAIKLVELTNNYHTRQLILQYATKVDCGMKTDSTYQANISRNGGELKIMLIVPVPPGTKAAVGAPQIWKLNPLPSLWTADALKGKLSAQDGQTLIGGIQVSAPPNDEATLLHLTTDIVICDDKAGECRMHTISAKVNISRNEGADDNLITVHFKS